MKAALLNDWQHLLLRWLFPMYFLKDNEQIDVTSCPVIERWWTASHKKHLRLLFHALLHIC